MSTIEMLTALNTDERRSVLDTASIVQQVLAGMVPDQRPTFSNSAMANLAHFLRTGACKSIPLLYSDAFTRGLYRHFAQHGRTDISEPMMDDIMAVADLCSETELNDIRFGAEQTRRKGPLFDFSVLNGYAVETVV